MPISCNFTNDATWLKMIGQVSRQDFFEGLLQAITDQRFVAGRYLVLDFQVDSGDLSTADLRYFAFQLATTKEKFSLPIICIVSDDLHFGLMRMLETFSSTMGLEVKIFRNERDVLKFFPVFWAEKNEPYQECL
jgi:hypothetical protein